MRLLGDSSGTAVVKTDFDYFAWSEGNGNGRLKRIKSEDVSPLTTLQDLRYYNTSTGAAFYDAVGNLTRIDDYKSGAPQSQYFGYDNLYRITSAYASGGTGGSGDYTTESYNYDPNTGNLASKSTVGSYSYGQQASGCMEGALAARTHAGTTAGSTIYCYTHDGDASRVKSTAGGVTTAHVGAYFME